MPARSTRRATGSARKSGSKRATATDRGAPRSRRRARSEGKFWHFPLPESGVEPLLRALIEGDAGILSLSIERAGLHDAFVAIAGEAAAKALEAEAEPVRMSAERLPLLKAAYVVARRDFVAILFSRAFFFFLLGPLFPVAVVALAGGVGQRVESAAAQPADRHRDAGGRCRCDARRAPALRSQLGPACPRWSCCSGSSRAKATTRARCSNGAKAASAAVLTGTPAAPELTAPPERLQWWSGPVALIAARRAQGAPRAYPEVKHPARSPTSGASEQRGRLRTAQAGQLMLFLLTMLLAGMVLSNLVEEKANKIIEILAAAIPMDAVFLGKLFAMLAISLVGIAVWATVIGGLIGLSGFEGLFGGAIDFDNLPAPGVGWPLFLLLGVVYFSMGYLLLGSIFLAIGSLATTVREVQTLSMPVTMLQVFLFFFATLAVSEPRRPIEWAAMAFPFSSPFAMLARAAQEEALWPHAVGARLAAPVGRAVHPLRRGAVPQAGDEVRTAGREGGTGGLRKTLVAVGVQQPFAKMCYRVRAMTQIDQPPFRARLARRGHRPAGPRRLRRRRAGQDLPGHLHRRQWRRRLTPAQSTRCCATRTPSRRSARRSTTKSARGTFLCAGLQQRALCERHQVRQRHRLAELLPPAAGRGRHLDRLQARLSAHRSALRRLRRAPGPRVQRRPATDRQALLHERAGDEVPPGRDGPSGAIRQTLRLLPVGTGGSSQSNACPSASCARKPSRRRRAEAGDLVAVGAQRHVGRAARGQRRAGLVRASRGTARSRSASRPRRDGARWRSRVCGVSSSRRGPISIGARISPRGKAESVGAACATRHSLARCGATGCAGRGGPWPVARARQRHDQRERERGQRRPRLHRRPRRSAAGPASAGGASRTAPRRRLPRPLPARVTNSATASAAPSSSA